MRRTQTMSAHARGMTLIEIMVVIAIIGMLGAAVTVFVMGQFTRAQRDIVATDFNTLESQLELYVLRKGSVPSQNQGLQVLLDAGISRKPAIDPWGNPYQYSVIGEEITLASLGADGLVGGNDNAADIVKKIKIK